MAEPFITQTWHELYVEFLADPFDSRTLKDWAFEQKIDPSTVCRWKSKHKAQIYAEASRRRKTMIEEIRSENWKNLMGRAKKDTKAIELTFKLLGDLVEKSETTHTYMKTDEKKTRITELLARAKIKEQAIEKFKAETSSQELPDSGSSRE